jgi:hypothetical protein
VVKFRVLWVVGIQSFWPAPARQSRPLSEMLEGVTFAFVCVDRGSARAGIFDLLISRGIPFIDVGMGLVDYRIG